MTTTSSTPAHIELQRAEQTFRDVIACLPLSEPARRALLAAASSWAKASAAAAGGDA
jgi:hypothetical protein